MLLGAASPIRDVDRVKRPPHSPFLTDQLLGCHPPEHVHT